MKGWNIFVEALRLIVENLGSALRSTLGPFLIAAGAMAVLATRLPVQVAGMEPPMVETPSGAEALLSFAVLGIVFMCYLWAAVAWHRALVLGEHPRGFLPPFSGGNMLSYFGTAFILGLGIAVVCVVLIIFLGAIFRPRAPGEMLMIAIPVSLVGSYLFFRLCPLLPARAVGHALGWSEAWKATGTVSGAILQLAIIAALANLLLQLPMQNAATATAPILNLIYSVVVSWLLFMVGISLMSVLYRHLIEAKPLGA